MSCECCYYPLAHSEKYYSVKIIDTTIIARFSRIDYATEWIRANNIKQYILKEVYPQSAKYQCINCGDIMEMGNDDTEHYSRTIDDLTQCTSGICPT